MALIETDLEVRGVWLRHRSLMLPLMCEGVSLFFESQE